MVQTVATTWYSTSLMWRTGLSPIFLIVHCTSHCKQSSACQRGTEAGDRVSSLVSQRAVSKSGRQVPTVQMTEDGGSATVDLYRQRRRHPFCGAHRCPWVQSAVELPVVVQRQVPMQSVCQPTTVAALSCPLRPHRGAQLLQFRSVSTYHPRGNNYRLDVVQI